MERLEPRISITGAHRRHVEHLADVRTAAPDRQLEASVHGLRRATLEVVKRAFEAAGVEFIDANNGGAGLRLANARSDRK